jgi:hypothetical protein
LGFALSAPGARSAATVYVTIKADTRSFRRGLIEVELGMPRRLGMNRRFGPGLLRRLRLRWHLWKVNREQAP